MGLGCDSNPCVRPPLNPLVPSLARVSTHFFACAYVRTKTVALGVVVVVRGGGKRQ